MGKGDFWMERSVWVPRECGGSGEGGLRARSSLSWRNDKGPRRAGRTEPGGSGATGLSGTSLAGDWG